MDLFVKNFVNDIINQVLEEMAQNEYHEWRKGINQERDYQDHLNELQDDWEDYIDSIYN